MAAEPDACVQPGLVSPEELVAYAGGDADPAVGEHLRRCRACSWQAGEYARMDRALHAGLSRRACPLTLTLGEYALGLLDDLEAASVRDHLEECRHCAAEYHAFAASLAESDEPDTSSPNFSATVRRLFALPIALPARAATLRGDDDDEETIRYAADGRNLTIAVQRGRDAPLRVIVGMLAEGFERSGVSVDLLHDGRVLQTEAVDDLGHFMFGDVPLGDYRLEIALTDVLVVVEPLYVV